MMNVDLPAPMIASMTLMVVVTVSSFHSAHVGCPSDSSAKRSEGNRT